MSHIDHMGSGYVSQTSHRACLLTLLTPGTRRAECRCLAADAGGVTMRDLLTSISDRQRVQ